MNPSSCFYAFQIVGKITVILFIFFFRDSTIELLTLSHKVINIIFFVRGSILLFSFSVPQKFLYTSSSQNKMYQIFRSAHEAGDSVVVQGGPWRPMMFDHILYSSESGRVFFSNSMNDTIMSMNLDGTGQEDSAVVIY